MSALGLGRVKTQLQKRRDSDLRWFAECIDILLSFEGFRPPTIPGRLRGAIGPLGENTLARRLCPHCRDEWGNADDVHDPREIVGEHV